MNLLDSCSNYEKVVQAIQLLTEKPHSSFEEISISLGMNAITLTQILKNWGNVSSELFLQFRQPNFLLQKLSPMLEDLFHSSASQTEPFFLDLMIKPFSKDEREKSSLKINYSVHPTPFGEALVASSPQGICYLTFGETIEKMVQDFHENFPNALKERMDSNFHEEILSYFFQQKKNHSPIHLHLKGTEFQHLVWQELLNIPFSSLVSYQQIANNINKPKASRAIGTAIGSNPVSLLIPCHRVIQSSGKLGGYMWGLERKSAILLWEQAQCQKQK